MIKETGQGGKFEIIFAIERATKNTVRFQEQLQFGEAVVGTLYVRKSFLTELGNPRKLKVTIEAVKEG